MPRLVVSEFITLDGVIEDPGGAEDFKYGGWSLQFFNDEYLKYKYDELFSSGVLLLGRITYQVFAEAWPSRTDPNGFADYMNSMPKFVVSTTLHTLNWKNAAIISGNIAVEVGKLKQVPGKDILVVGSGQLVRALMQLDLVDEYRLLVHPVVLGAGKKLFDGMDNRRMLELKDAKVFSSGIVVFTYRPARKNCGFQFA